MDGGCRRGTGQVNSDPFGLDTWALLLFFPTSSSSLGADWCVTRWFGFIALWLGHVIASRTFWKQSFNQRLSNRRLRWNTRYQPTLPSTQLGLLGDKLPVEFEDDDDEEPSLEDDTDEETYPQT